MTIFDVTIDFNNAVTIAIIAIVAFFAVLGLFKGFMRSVIALLCFGASIGLAVALMDQFLELLSATFSLDLEGIFTDLLQDESLSALQGVIGDTGDVASIAAQVASFAILFIVFQLLMGLVAKVLYNVIGTVKPTLTDSLLGMTFYAAIGLAVVTLALGAASVIPVESIQTMIGESELASTLQEWALKILPLG